MATTSSEFKPTSTKFTPTYHSDTYPFIAPTKHDLTGLTVLITGASRGIGAAIARSYAAAGASRIAIAARAPPTHIAEAIVTAAQSSSRAAPQILSLAIDVTSQSSVQAAVKQVEAAFGGRLDVLVNNAGYLEHFNAIAESDPAEWWTTMTINLQGPYLLSRAFVPLLLATKGGQKTILNTASIGALVVMPGGSGYQTSKLALLRLTEFLAVEYGDKGLLTTAFHPGGVVTDLGLRLPEEIHAQLQDTPQLAGDSAVWATAERREWLQGRYFSVNWDMEELEREKGRIVEEDLLKVKLAV
ncbi:unnamed protein product [Discula destructiva]